METTIAAIATPPGKGGIACVRISGPQALEIAAKVFMPVSKKKDVRQAAGYTAMFGHFYRAGRRCDETVALFFRAPHSYTGEDVAELSCHGGLAVVRELLTACLEAGAVPAGPGEFTRRAFLSGRISLTQAEAVMDMVEAENRQSAAAAGAAMEGALWETVRAMREKLLTLAGHIAAYTDYPEEEVEELSPEHLSASLRELTAGLQKLVADYDRGALLRRGAETVIVGAPNVGKSTILNLLAGFDKAIVTPVPGTTRDVVEQAVELSGVTLLLADTAGLRDTQDTVEKEGIRRSLRRMESAAFVLAVFDASRPFGEAERALAERCRGRAALAVRNKSDLPALWGEAVLQPYFDHILTFSAEGTGGREALEKAVLSALDLTGLDPDAALLANRRQLSCAKQALDALTEALHAQEAGFALDAVGVCVQDALTALGRLTGEDVTEAVVDEVFSRFCVGK